MKILNKKLIMLFVLICPVLLSSCYNLKKTDVDHAVIAQKEKQYIDITIIEGKTTKQELIDKLGMPDDINNTSMSYSLHNNKNLCFRL